MKRLFGGLLAAVGILIMLTSGLCTLVVGPAVIYQDVSGIILALVFGAPPFALGFGLFKWGRGLLRKPEDHNLL
ncbi:MAG: hypothetical protein K2X68_12615 [Novosphingobium sp.]|nr:hypothetical protein [Novosphingobium sp.]